MLVTFNHKRLVHTVISVGLDLHIGRNKHYSQPVNKTGSMLILEMHDSGKLPCLRNKSANASSA